MDSERIGRRMPLTVEQRKEKHNHRNRVVRFRIKEEAVQYMGGKCEHCDGVFHTAAYDFHHVDPTQKDVDPGSLMRGLKHKLYAELDKCILLCANCHRIHHWKEANKDTDLNLYIGPELLTYNGESLTFEEWSKRTGLSVALIRGRLNDEGWSVERTLSTPKITQHSREVKLEYNGVTKTLKQWSEEYGITVNTIRSRLNLGWSMDEIFKPVYVAGQGGYKNARKKESSS